MENIVERIRVFSLAAVDLDWNGIVDSQQEHLAITHIHGDNDEAKRANLICKHWK
jgi:hypothetical protein